MISDPSGPLLPNTPIGLQQSVSWKLQAVTSHPTFHYSIPPFYHNNHMWEVYGLFVLPQVQELLCGRGEFTWILSSIKVLHCSGRKSSSEGPNGVPIM